MAKLIVFLLTPTTLTALSTVVNPLQTSVGRHGRLAKITSPTLIPVGHRDTFCPVELACTAYRTLDSGRLSILPRAGHDIGQRAAATIIEFLQSQQ